MLTAESVRQRARTLGFDLCGVAPAEAVPLAARIIASVIPDPGYAALFAENLRRAAGA
jgi:hypothetical protein